MCLSKEAFRGRLFDMASGIGFDICLKENNPDRNIGMRVEAIRSRKKKHTQRPKQCQKGLILAYSDNVSFSTLRSNNIIFCLLQNVSQCAWLAFVNYVICKRRAPICILILIFRSLWWKVSCLKQSDWAKHRKQL